MAQADTPTDPPEQSWTNPFGEHHPLHDLYARRVKNNQDLIIILDDYHARRGTGKTVASLQLAEGMDQNGGITKEHVTMAPQELRNAYYQLPERSGIVLDEGEVSISNRQSMTKVNQSLRAIMSEARIEEKYLIINTPSVGFIDKDIRLLADVWITMTSKGTGLVHFLKRQPYSNQGSGQVLTEKEGLVTFKDIQPNTRLRDVYDYLTREKRKHIRGEEGDGFVTQEEHTEALEQAREQARQEQRNEIIVDIHRRLNEQFDEDDLTRVKRTNGISQAMIGEAVGLTQPQIGNILRDNG